MTQSEGGGSITWSSRAPNPIATGFWDDGGYWNDLGFWSDNAIWSSASGGTNAWTPVAGGTNTWNDIASGDRSE
jgi:hypothetical protein